MYLSSSGWHIFKVTWYQPPAKMRRLEPRALLWVSVGQRFWSGIRKRSLEHSAATGTSLTHSHTHTALRVFFAAQHRDTHVCIRRTHWVDVRAVAGVLLQMQRKEEPRASDLGATGPADSMLGGRPAHRRMFSSDPGLCRVVVISSLQWGPVPKTRSWPDVMPRVGRDGTYFPI